uniref:Serine carboxypeptidase-like 18 n=1 Tax=Fagus sylvatica TaxID=28930 RepID=A0A2N9EZ84_FAGSY
MFSSNFITLFWVLAFAMFLCKAKSQSIVETLPGFPGILPFKLETGYVGVGEVDEVQLFYYFIESEGNPKKDPLLLWLTGGPGCSAFSGLVYEIGPLTFNYEDFDGNLPTFLLNPYSWTKVASIIFLDAPVGTGFSYSRTSQGYNITDKLSAAQTYEFLRKWLMNHPKFLSNVLYVSGDSYSGIVVPILVQEIYNGNRAGHVPIINLNGYVLGNPVTDRRGDVNSQIEYSHRLALISDELYESVKESCHGEYVRVDPKNVQCLIDLEAVNECIGKLEPANILEPLCPLISPNSSGMDWNQVSLEEGPMDILLSWPQPHALWCRVSHYVLSYIWANDKTVQNALHIREGTILNWVRCNKTLSYTYDVISTVEYHRNLTKTNYRSLIYSGDHDLNVPYVGTQEWIRTLNMTVSDDWEPWFVEGQVAGYTVKFTKNTFYHMTFATGAGHTAPEYKPKECLAMVERWLANYPL